MPTPGGLRLVAVSLALAVALALVGTLPSRRAAAQTSEGEVGLVLVRQPIWHEEGDALGLELRIDNASSEALEAPRIQLIAYERVESRTALHESFERPPGLLIGVIGATVVEFPAAEVRPGASITVPVNDSLTSLNLLGDRPGGVYPLQAILYDARDSPLASVNTELIFYPSPPQTRLDLALVLPLSDIPARSPGGRFERDPLTGRWPLEAALESSGWLRAAVEALDAAGGLHLAVAPVPRLVEEISDMADGYARDTGDEIERVGPTNGRARAAASLLDDLDGILSRPGIQPLLVPYSAPDLPALAGRLRPGRQDPVALQLQHGSQVLRTELRRAYRSGSGGQWLFPPAGRMDAVTLDQVQRPLQPVGEPYRTLFSADSLRDAVDPSQAGCPRGFASFTCPVMVDADIATRGLVADAGLQQRLEALARRGAGALEMQRFFAETAMIREELPEVENRVVHAVIPALWHPGRGPLGRLLGGIERAPWLRTRTPQETLAGAGRPEPRQVVGDAESVPGAPAADFYAAVAAASEVVDSFTAIEAPDELIQRLRRDILVAQSRLWWRDPELLERGLGYAHSAAAAVHNDLANITIGGRNEITLTSRRQPIPLVLYNRNPYPVKVTVTLNSTELSFEDGPTDTLTLPPGNQPLAFQAIAQSSGTFPLDVSLSTPGGQTLIGDKTIRVRSTEFNRVALALTIGALAFLVLFYVLRALRRRRSSSAGDGAGAATA